MNARKLMTNTLAAAVLATLGASQAHAIDGKTYPGSMCVRASESTTGSPSASNRGRIFNTATTKLVLECPAVHDVAGTVAGGRVDVVDLNLGSDVTNDETTQACATLFSAFQSATSSTLTLKNTARVCTKGAVNAKSRITIPGLSTTPEEDYFYRISLPGASTSGQSAIISYAVNENN